MYTKKELVDLLFFDIETAAQYESFEKLQKFQPQMAKIWLDKYHPKHVEHKNLIDKMKVLNITTDSDVYDFIYKSSAGLYPEYGKVISIVFGTINDELKLNVVDICDHDELEILEAVGLFLNSNNGNLSGFNIKGFDIPFLAKRYILNSKKVPNPLQVRGLKPWEMKFVDLMEDWKMGGFNNSISLDLLCNAIGVPTPKDGIQNYEVGYTYYTKKEGLKEINDYCIKDVFAVMRATLKISGLKEKI